MLNESISKLKYSELNNLLKLHSRKTPLGKEVREEIIKRATKRHTYQPFKDLKKIG